jgi:hypothetical protein
MTKGTAGREDFVNLLNEVSIAQNVLIDAHEVVFNQKFGQELNYKILESSISEAREAISGIVFLLEGEGEINDFNRDDADIVKRYALALKDSADLLLGIVTGLREKADGHQYKWLHYRKDLRGYKASQSTYIALGSHLNNLYRKYS